MQIKITRRLKALTKIIPTPSERRPSLENILIEKGEAIATDGYIIIHQKLEQPLDAQQSPNEPDRFVMPASILSSLPIWGKRSDPRGIATLFVENDRTCLEVSNGDGKMKFSHQLHSFPETVHLMKCLQEEVQFSIAISPTLLKRLAESVQGERMLILRFRSPHTAVEFTGRDTGVHGLLMPMWADREDSACRTHCNLLGKDPEKGNTDGQKSEEVRPTPTCG